MSKWIDRMATFDPSDSMRSDKVAFYFNDAGLLQCSLDGKTALSIPFAGATVITAARTIIGADNGTTLLVNQPASGVAFTLPAAAVVGKMSVTLVTMNAPGVAQAVAHSLVPFTGNTIKGNGTVGAGTVSATVTMMKLGTPLPFQKVVLTSDGVLTWLAIGSGTPPALTALEAEAAEKAEKAEAEKLEKAQKLVDRDKDEDESKGRLVKKKPDEDEDDKKKK